MIKQYKSKISYGLLIFIFLVFYVPLIPNLINGEINEKLIVSLLLLTILFVFILYLFFGTEYIIDNDKLLIKCGPFKYKPIKIEQIREISKTNNIISSPAPSFDRIEIKYGKYDDVIISPINKNDFALELIKINPNIKNNLNK